jgi:hypothetical protein
MLTLYGTFQVSFSFSTFQSFQIIKENFENKEESKE